MHELLSRMVRLPDPNCILKKDQNHVELAGHSLHPGYEGPPMVTIELLRIRHHMIIVEVLDRGSSGRSNFGSRRQRVAGFGSILCPIFEFRRR